MKVLSVSGAKARLGKVIDQVIRSREPVVIPRGQRHVMIAPYDLPTPDEIQLSALFQRMDKGRAPVEENEEAIEEIRAEVRKIRAEKRRRK
jgi:hypothetical protein